MKTYFVRLWPTFLLTLSACGNSSAPNGSATGPGGENTKPPITSANYDYLLTSFDVLGIDENGQQTAEAPATDQGEFSLSWEVQKATTAYAINAFVSVDNIYSEDDIKFYGAACAENTYCGGIPSPVVDCALTNSLSISCMGSTEVTIANVLTELPKTLYIIFESCGNDGANCDSKTALLTFQ